MEYFPKIFKVSIVMYPRQHNMCLHPEKARESALQFSYSVLRLWEYMEWKIVNLFVGVKHRTRLVKSMLVQESAARPNDMPMKHALACVVVPLNYYFSRLGRIPLDRLKQEYWAHCDIQKIESMHIFIAQVYFIGISPFKTVLPYFANLVTI